MDMSQIVSPIDSIPFDLSTNVEELADSEALLATPEQGPLQRNDLGKKSIYNPDNNLAPFTFILS